MKRIGLIIFTSTTVILLSVGIACKKSNTGSSSSAQDSVLINIGNNIIVPSYQSLGNSVSSLDIAIHAFISTPNTTTLATLQIQFKATYVAWESVSEYNYFGPASTSQPTLTTLNVFPTTTTTIENNISANNDNINTFANTAAKGFPAMDYLLFGANNATIVTNYTTDANATNRKNYLTAVWTDIKTEVTSAETGWLSSGGNYIATFINGTGNSVSSSLGLLINSLDEDFENLKNYRLGVPLGKIPVGVTSPVEPSEVEAYYSGISVQLAVAQLKAVQGVYLGTTFNGNGLGLHTYLERAEQQKNLKYNGGLLSDTIRIDLAQAVTDLQALPDPLSATIQADPTNADKVFAECQQLVALLKTDMPSELGVLINYGDNDGD